MLYSLGREDQSVVEWTKIVGPLVTDAKEFPVKSFGSFVSAWANSVAFLGESELHARKAERYEVFGLDKGVQSAAVQRFKQLNDMGIQGLQKTRGMLASVRTELAAYDKKLAASGRKLAAELAEHRTAMLAGFAEVEMKRSDAEQLRAIIDDAIATTEKKGLAGLADWMDAKMAEAIAVRQKPDRGAATNFAIWKLAAVIALLAGLGIAFWIHCGWFSCTAYSRDNYIRAILVTAGLWWC